MSSASEKRLLDKKNAEIEKLFEESAMLVTKKLTSELLDKIMEETQKAMDETKKKLESELKTERESTRKLKSENRELKRMLCTRQGYIDETLEKLRQATDEVQCLRLYMDRLAVLEKQVASILLRMSPPATIPNCKICLLPYNETPEKTPRVLKCGHTVCEECIVTIRNMHIQTNRNSAERNIVLCPFDRTETELKEGSARSLPKNFTVMEMIDSGLEAMRL